MRIRDLKNRENYNTTLGENLSKLLGFRSRECRVLLNDRSGVQSWYHHTLFDVYVPWDFDVRGRRWLTRLYARSPRLVRRIPQWLACNAAQFPMFDRVLLQYAFDTTASFGPSVMIMPGNQRFRLFDFGSRSVLATNKYDFDSERMNWEIEFRSREGLPSFIPPCRQVADKSFEEPLFDAVPLIRLPFPSQRYHAEVETHLALRALSQLDRHVITSDMYLRELDFHYVTLLNHLQEKFGRLDFDTFTACWRAAHIVVLQHKEVEMSRSHGDFQPGNLLFDADGNLALVDWEYTGVRASCYDAMVWHLRSRSHVGLAMRAWRFLHQKTALPPYLARFGLSRAELLSLWFLEETSWLLTSSSARGIVNVPGGLARVLQECNIFIAQKVE